MFVRELIVGIHEGPYTRQRSRPVSKRLLSVSRLSHARLPGSDMQDKALCATLLEIVPPLIADVLEKEGMICFGIV